MISSQLTKRIAFCVELLTALNHFNHQLEALSNQISQSSKDFFIRFFYENKSELTKDIGTFQSNYRAICEYHYEMTTQINDWYAFSKNQQAVSQVFYPLVFYRRKKTLIKKLKKINAQISSLIIENRLIQDRIAIWEHELKNKAMKKMDQQKDSIYFYQLLEARKSILQDLLYLLPTIQGICPTELDTLHPDRMEHKLKAL